MTFLRPTLLAAVAVLLAACGSDDTGRLSCPEVRIDRDTARLTEFVQGRGQDITDVKFEAEIADYAGDCDIDMEDQEITVRMKVAFSVTKGPALGEPIGSFEYFVAVPSFYPAADGKQILPVQFKFPEGNVQTMMLRDEEVKITIPMKDRTVEQTPLYVGFQLSPGQLEYNRRFRR